MTLYVVAYRYVVNLWLCTVVCEERTWAREAEESPPLEAVDRKRLVKKQQAGKGLAVAVVIWELWRLAMAQ
jgi:hypothetical protein